LLALIDDFEHSASHIIINDPLITEKGKRKKSSRLDASLVAVG